MVATTVKKPIATVRGYSVSESTVGEFDTLPEGRVDRAAKIIRGVKVLGLESVNTARLAGFPAALGDDILDMPYGYAEQALADAVPLYENARVFFDHPKTGIDSAGRRVTTLSERQFRSLVGRLVNVRFVPGSGLFADLEYLESEPLSAKLVEAAERMPEQIALSHRAYVHPVRLGDRVVVDRVLHVTSVDIVTENPGTTETLFESAPTMADPIMTPTPPVTEGAEGLPGAAAPAAVTDPKEALKAGTKAAINAVVDGEGTAADKGTKIVSLLEQLELGLAAIGGGSAAKPAAGADAGTKAAESANAEQLRLAMAKTGAVTVLETAGVRVTTARINMIASMPEADRASVLEQFKTLDGANVLESGTVPARSGGAGPAGAAPVAAFSHDGFLAGLKG